MQKIFQDKCRAKNRKKKMEMRKRRYEKKLKALIEQRELGFAENGTASYLQGTTIELKKKDHARAEREKLIKN